FQSHHNPRDLHSFPTRRSSDLIYNIPQTIITSTLTLAYVAAFYRICKSIIAGEKVNDDYFYFFTKAHFVKVLILAITYTGIAIRSEEHTSELQSRENLVCRLLL